MPFPSLSPPQKKMNIKQWRRDRSNERRDKRGIGLSLIIACRHFPPFFRPKLRSLELKIPHSIMVKLRDRIENSFRAPIISSVGMVRSCPSKNCNFLFPYFLKPRRRRRHGAPMNLFAFFRNVEKSRNRPNWIYWELVRSWSQTNRYRPKATNSL